MLHNCSVNWSLDYINEDLLRTFNNELVNNLGNLVSRVKNLKFFPTVKNLEITTDMLINDQLCKKLPALIGIYQTNALYFSLILLESISRSYDEHKFHVGIQEIISFLFDVNARINQCKPWELAKTDPERLPGTMAPIFLSVGVALKLLEPILVKTSIGSALLPDVSSMADLHSRITLPSNIDVNAFLGSNSAALFPRLNQ